MARSSFGCAFVFVSCVCVKDIGRILTSNKSANNSEYEAKPENFKLGAEKGVDFLFYVFVHVRHDHV